MNTVPQKSSKTQPAVGQVWRWPSGETRIIDRVNNECLGKYECAFWHDYTSWMGTPTSDMHEANGWSCIGIETPGGRVMVGERRREPGRVAWEVASVTGTADAISGPLVYMTGGGGANGTFSARLVATWPLLPPEPAPRDGVTFASRASGCVCQWEHGDRACPVHPTCKACGCVVCECVRKPRDMGPLAAAASQAFREPAQWDHVKLGAPSPGGVYQNLYQPAKNVLDTLAAAGLKVDAEALADRLGLRWAPEASPEMLAATERAATERAIREWSERHTSAILPHGVEVRILDPRAEREQRRRAISAVLDIAMIAGRDVAFCALWLARASVACGGTVEGALRLFRANLLR